MHPTKAAESFLTRAYHRTARTAARTERSEPALRKLGWSTWERRRAACRAAFVAKVWHEGEPAALRELLPEPPQLPTDGMHTRAALRGEVQEPMCNIALGRKAFSNWGPTELNQVLRNEVFEGCAPQQAKQKRGMPKVPQGSVPAHGPSDIDVVVRQQISAHCPSERIADMFMMAYNTSG
eukprot:gene19370-biopygen8999